MDWMALKSGSDVRGVAVGENAALTSNVAQALGAAFVRMLCDHTGKAAESLTVSIGRDSRISGPELALSAAKGMAQAGAKVLDFGLCTTPAMYMSILTEGFKADGAVMVTASHHPYNLNGLKFFEEKGGFSGEEITKLLQDASALTPDSLHGGGAISQKLFLPAYQKQLSDRINKGLGTNVARPLSGLNVAVDAGNGAGGFYAGMLQDLGARVDGSQFLEPDGMFPNHIPNPENEDAMTSLSAAVKRAKADLGVIFDADCDRAAIVDDTGKEINRNRLIALISAILLSEKPGQTIVTDSVTSSGLKEFITEWGGTHYRFKRGYRNVIDEAVRLNASGIDCPLAIETSGHAAFRENHFLDDGMYLTTLLIVEAMKRKQAGKTLGSLIAKLREPVESAEIRLKITAADFRFAGKAAIQQVLDCAESMEDWHIAPDSREGVRINFDLGEGFQNGWFLLRLSVHDPVLPLNVESDVPGGMKYMLESLLKAIGSAPGIDIQPIREELDKLHD
jgi:phosphomannomutase